MELFNINNRILLIISISSLLLSSYLLASSAHGDDDFVVRHSKPHKMRASRIPMLKTPHQMRATKLPMLKTPHQLRDNRLPVLKTPHQMRDNRLPVPKTPHQMRDNRLQVLKTPHQMQDNRLQVLKSPLISTAPRIVVPSINSFCRTTTYPDLCRSTILPSLHNRLLTPALALQLEIKACLDRTQLSLAVLKKINHASPVLKDLKENFGSVVENLKVAAAAIAKHDVGTVKTRLSAVITDFSTCKDSIAEVQGGFKLGAAFKVEETDKLHKLASNCLALSTLL